MAEPYLCGADLIDLGVDWLTCTTNNQKDTEDARSVVVGIMDDERALGNDVVPWRMSGFEGLKCGQIQFGFRTCELIVRLTGGLAHKEYRRFHELASNVSRIDLQVTTHNGASARSRVGRCYRRARAFKRKHNHRRILTPIFPDQGGWTLYIGQWSSTYLGRIYCKGMMRNSSYPLEAVRAEVQIRDEVAKRMYDALVCNRAPLMQIASFVSTWFGQAGLPISDLPETFDLYKGFAKATDADRRLTWLRTQVRPCVRSLKDIGRLQEAVDALGLSDDCLIVQEDTTPC